VTDHQQCQGVLRYAWRHAWTLAVFGIAFLLIVIATIRCAI